MYKLPRLGVKLSYSYNSCSPLAWNALRIPARRLNAGEVAAALRPFYFSVHPDLFGQHPKERAVNEDSLKLLNEYLEILLEKKRAIPKNVTFFLRSQNTKNFRTVSIQLHNASLREAVQDILQKCDLPTTTLDKIPEQPKHTAQSRHLKVKHDSEYEFSVDVKIRQRKLQEDNLVSWLEKHILQAQMNLAAWHQTQKDIQELRVSLCEVLELKDILWDCGWGKRHFRGCLQSFQALVTHHKDLMGTLKGRTVVFGRESGVSLGGNVVLNSGEVRNNWLDMIKNVPKHDNLILRIPSVERAVSKSLSDIQVVHRQFQPTRLAESYEEHLRKIATSLGDYKGRCGFPKIWPENMSHLQLVVETDAGPLTLSPTGQFIVPASCPVFLLVNYITENMEEAIRRLDANVKFQELEQELHSRCMSELNLFALDKDDSIIPEKMISCCERLLARKAKLYPYLNGLHLSVTTYYSVLSDGEMCIPWNWKD